MHAVGVLPELREAVAEVLVGSLLTMTQEQDPDRISFAKLVLLSWNVVPMMVEAKPAAGEFWSVWGDQTAQENIDVLLAPGPGEEDAWVIALLRGYVDMDAFLDASGQWSPYILDALFHAQQNTPLQFGYAAWAAGRLGLSDMRHLPDPENRERYDMRLEQLRQLGKRLTVPPDEPWISRAYRGFPTIEIADNWDPLGDDEDIHWAIWALFMCALESAEKEFGGRPAPSVVGTSTLVKNLLESRSRGQDPPDGTFEETMFCFQGERGEMRDVWARGSLNVTSAKHIKLPRVT